jgi:hypothetical protein
MFTVLRKRNFTLMRNLLNDFAKTLTETNEKWKQTIKDYEHALALCLEASQQRDRAMETADLCRQMYEDMLKRCQHLERQKASMTNLLANKTSRETVAAN